VAHITHHEVVIRWDGHRSDDASAVMSDAKLTEA
jgi:hypothetical protein